MSSTITLRKITNEMYNADTDNFYRKIGNYSVKRCKYFTGVFIEHFYYGNKICQVNVYNKTFELYNCGYDKNPLTTVQLNYLEKFYKDKGYELKYRGI